MLKRPSFISRLPIDAEKLRATDGNEGNLDPEECPDAGLNNETEPGPDAACREERCRLRHRQFIRRPHEVARTRDHQAPLHERRPEEYCSWPFIRETTQLGSTE